MFPSPVVAHATGSVSRLPDYGKGGLPVRIQEPRGYAEALLRMAKAPEENFARARYARRMAEMRSSPALAADRHVELYHSLLATPSGSRRIVYD